MPRQLKQSMTDDRQMIQMWRFGLLVQQNPVMPPALWLVKSNAAKILNLVSRTIVRAIMHHIVWTEGRTIDHFRITAGLTLIHARWTPGRGGAKQNISYFQAKFRQRQSPFHDDVNGCFPQNIRPAVIMVIPKLSIAGRRIILPIILLLFLSDSTQVPRLLIKYRHDNMMFKFTHKWSDDIPRFHTKRKKTMW